jgi:hypothetical protein
MPAVAVSRADRSMEREPCGREDDAALALDLLEFVERAWYDSDNEITPPEEIIDDMSTAQP